LTASSPSSGACGRLRRHRLYPFVSTEARPIVAQVILGLLLIVVANRAYVLKNGRVALSGLAAEVKDDPGVRKAYLGL
jgi:hypothetical protein